MQTSGSGKGGTWGLQRLAAFAVMLCLPHALVACGGPPAPASRELSDAAVLSVMADIDVSPQEAPLAPAGQPACFRQSDVSAGWDLMPYHTTEEACFDSDSCTGGRGNSAGGCYKWAVAADGPALPWTIPIIERSPTATPDEDGPPLNDGLYELATRCVKENGCTGWPWIANVRIPLYARPDPRSAVATWIEAGGTAVTGDYIQLFALKRGTLETELGPGHPGDAVYALAEYCGGRGYDLWVRGEVITGTDDGGIRWDPVPGLRDPRHGSWQEFRLANGQSGWARHSVMAEPLMSPVPSPGKAEDAIVGDDSDADEEQGEFDDYDGCE